LQGNCTKINCKNEGKQALIESLHLYPYNWSCWLALLEFVDSISDVVELSNEFEFANSNNEFEEPFLMLECWKIHALNELHCSPETVLPILDPLETIYPKNKYIK
jgi:hypothetical protein